MRTLLLAVLIAAGCHNNPPPQPPAPAPEPTPAPAPEPTPAPEPVAEEPAPVVKDTLKHLEVSSEGIRLKRGLTIKFKTDSEVLLPESSPILDEVAMVMTQNEKIKIRIEGHTDNAGNKDHNQDLSTRRAGAVKAYLQGKSIAVERLDSVGCGQTTPIADNATDAGKAENRRVEFVVIRKKHPRENCTVYVPKEHRKGEGKDGGAPMGGKP